MKPVPDNLVHCFKHAKTHRADEQCPDCAGEWLRRKLAQNPEPESGLLAISPDIYKEMQRTEGGYMPQTKDTETHEHPRRLLTAWTLDPSWPSWVLRSTGTEYLNGEKPVHKLDRQP